MRLKRLMSIVLVVTLAMSFAMSASADTTYYDEDFNDLTFSLNSSSTAEDKAAFATATGWTMQVIDGATVVSTVDAATENAAWTGRGKVLKMDGSAGTSTLQIRVPFTKFPVSNTASNLFIEYDLLIPADLSGHALYNIFGANVYDMFWSHQNNTAYRRLHLESGTIGNYGPITNKSAYTKGTWLRVSSKISNTSDGKTNMAWTITNISTGVTQTFSSPVYAGLYNVNTLYLGGNGGGYLASANTVIGKYYIDNVDIYLKDAFGFTSSTAAGAEDVAVDTPYIDVVMNDSVDEASISGITVSSASDTASVTPSVLADGKTIRLTFGRDLAYDATYTVDFSKVKNTTGDTVGGTTSFTFTTEAAPEFVASISTNSHVKGSMGEAKVVISNNHATNSKNVAVIYAVYSSAGKLVDVVYANDTIAPQATTTISAGVKLGNDAAKAKVMLWDGISTVSPLTGFTYAEVTAAQ